MGRLTKDPELRRTQSDVPFVSFCIACDRDYQPGGTEKKADFFNCTAWRGTAEFISNYFRKGKMILISGRLETRQWKDDGGKTHSATDIVCDSVYFADSKVSPDVEVDDDLPY
jgi:single-strand binding protein